MSACLGVGEYAARFVQRPLSGRGPVALGEVTCSAGTWERVISATSTASVVIPIRSDAGLLGRLVPWRHELEILRDGALCWAGPLTDLIVDPGAETVTIPASDLSAWWAFRHILTDLVFRGVDLSAIFADLVQLAEAAAPIGLAVDARPSGVTGDRTYAAIDVREVLAELTDLARTGCDWTVTGRQVWIGGQEIAPGRRLASPLLDEAFVVPPQTRLSGDMVTEAIVRGSQVLGRAGGVDPDGVLIQRVRDESSIEDKASADAAARTWRDRAHDPLPYVDGDAQLRPSAPVQMNELIPGLVARLDLDGSGVLPVSADLRLERLTVSFDESGEAPVVAFQPLGTVEAA